MVNPVGKNSVINNESTRGVVARQASVVMPVMEIDSGLFPRAIKVNMFDVVPLALPPYPTWPGSTEWQQTSIRVQRKSHPLVTLHLFRFVIAVQYSAEYLKSLSGVKFLQGR